MKLLSYHSKYVEQNNEKIGYLSSPHPNRID